MGGGLGGRKEKKSKQALEEEDVRAKAEAARARAAANIPPAPRSEERRDKRERWVTWRLGSAGHCVS